MKEFLTKERGITEETLKAFDVKAVGNKAILPYYSRDKSDILFEKERVIESDGKRKFYTTKGSKPTLFGMQHMASLSNTVFLTEGESDTMRLWQEFGQDEDSEPGVCGLPGIELWKPEWADHFEGIDTIYVILDNDSDYSVQARVDNCWRSIRKDLGARAKRIKLPDTVKDVCEFFDKYTLDTFDRLVEKSTLGVLHFDALDLSISPKPYDWLVKDWLCRGDVALKIGPPGIAKSMLAMDLSVAIAEESRKMWLGKKLMRHGRVLYFDEENPEDVIRSRLKRLGLKNFKNLRYVHNAGVRVDRPMDREKILEEVETFQPELVVFDSLTRFHTGDENNAGYINELFGDCFKPIARDTGSTVLILHHVNKSEFGSSFVRARGSGDLTASIDTGFDVDSLDGAYGRFFVKQYKSRRGESGATVYAAIRDVGKSGLEIETIPLVL